MPGPMSQLARFKPSGRAWTTHMTVTTRAPPPPPPLRDLDRSIPVDYSKVLLSYFLDTMPKDVTGEEPNWVFKPFMKLTKTLLIFVDTNLL